MYGTIADAQSFKDTLEDEDVARYVKHAFLVVSVLLGRFVEELDEDGVVEELCADDEAFHGFPDVHGEVALGNGCGSGFGTGEVADAEGV